MSRINLNVRAYCSKCGEQLSFILNDKAAKAKNNGCGTTQSGFEVGLQIHIEPCHGCLAPARKIKDAIKDLFEESDDDNN